jgi:isoaspartyl peptidase/L-asparaginase-like protein (Ntn-hydrolase superfamily)
LTARVVLAIHGGAGKPPVDAAAHAAAERALVAALEVGWSIMQAGGAALDATERAVASLEESGCFNAGRGAVADSGGGVTLDAAIMDGPTRAAGAVAAVEKIGTAIRAARLVMERTSHVVLAGPAADAFALAAGLPAAPAGYFVRAQAASDAGTVGAVARDAAGRLAAATATGGLAGKLPGRVGDSPVIGAGTWADRRCAVSATGAGEYFIRTAFASEVARGLALSGLTLAASAGRAMDDVIALGGHGGCIAVDASGTVVMPFSTPVMYRGVIDASGPRVGVFPQKDDAERK